MAAARLEWLGPRAAGVAAVVPTAAMALLHARSHRLRGPREARLAGVPVSAAAAVATVAAASSQRSRGAQDSRGLTGFVLVAAVTLALALWPGVAVWRRRCASTCRSRSAKPVGAGACSTDRTGSASVVYATRVDGTRLELDVWPANDGAGGRTAPGDRAGARRRVDARIARRSLGLEPLAEPARLRRVRRRVRASATGSLAGRGRRREVRARLGRTARRGVPPRPPAHQRDGVLRRRQPRDARGVRAWETLAFPPSCDVAPVAVRSVVNLYGPADLTLLYRSSGSRDYIDDALRQYVGGSPSEYPGALPGAVAGQPRGSVDAADAHAARRERPDRADRSGPRSRPGAHAGGRRARHVPAAGHRPRLRRQLERVRHADRARDDREIPPTLRLSDPIGASESTN